MLEDILYIWKTFYESLYIQQIDVLIYSQNPKNCLLVVSFFPGSPLRFVFVNLIFYSYLNPDLIVTHTGPILAKFLM